MKKIHIVFPSVLAVLLLCLLAVFLVQRGELRSVETRLADSQAQVEAAKAELEEARGQMAELQIQQAVAAAPTEPDDPITACFAKLFAEYGNSHADGYLYFLKGEAWKAELYHAAEQIEGGLTFSEDVKAVDDYLSAVEALAGARNGLSGVLEGDTTVSPDEPGKRFQWAGTGYSGRVGSVVAGVYCDAFQSLMYQGYGGYTFVFNEAETRALFQNNS